MDYDGLEECKIKHEGVRFDPRILECITDFNLNVMAPKRAGFFFLGISVKGKNIGIKNKKH